MFRRVLESVAASLMTYGAIRMIESSDKGQLQLDALLLAVRTFGIRWTIPLWIASGMSMVLGIAALAASNLIPLPGGVGAFDPFEPTFALDRLGRFLIGAAVASGVGAGGFALMGSGASWGIVFLAAPAWMAIRWITGLPARMRRVMSLAAR